MCFKSIIKNYISGIYDVSGGTVTTDESKNKTNQRNYSGHAVHNEGMN